MWAPLDEVSAGDPIDLYDSELDQWIITEFTAPGVNTLLIGISETSDPFGSYFVYSFSAPTFPDYPKYGIWRDFLIITTNEAAGGGRNQNLGLHQYFIDRDAIISEANQDDVNVQRIEIEGFDPGVLGNGFIVITPVNWLDGPEPPNGSSIVVRLNDSSWRQLDEDAIEIITFNIDLENPGKTEIIQTILPTTPYDSFPCSHPNETLFECVQQLGTAVGLTGFPQVITNVPQYRNFETHESIVLFFITDVTNGENISRIRWMELRKNRGY